jgi:hypothetical protein
VCTGTKMFETNLPICWNRIDELTRRDHAYLKPEDVCLYLTEYSARGERVYGDGCRLVAQLLCATEPGREAIDQVADFASRALNQGSEPAARSEPGWSEANMAPWQSGQTAPAETALGIIVPLPSLQSGGGGRQILQSLAQESTSGIQELIAATPPKPGARLQKPKDFAAHYRLSGAAIHPQPHAIGLFGICLASGAHFRAAKDLLAAHFKGVPVYGLFLARLTRGSSAADA